MASPLPLRRLEIHRRPLFLFPHLAASHYRSRLTTLRWGVNLRPKSQKLGWKQPLVPRLSPSFDPEQAHQCPGIPERTGR